MSFHRNPSGAASPHGPTGPYPLLWKRLLVLVCFGLGLLTGCTSKSTAPDQPILPPVDPTDSIVVVVDNVVQWRTTSARRGSVRYGYTRGAFDHMAYPLAANRQDKQLRTEHEVPLLDLQLGRMLYYQVVNETANNVRTFAPLDSFEVLDVRRPSLLTSTMIHIGFGDSHLITMPNGKRLLIDGGEAAAASSVAQYFAEHGISGVDAMLGTHVHIDHMGSMGVSSGTDPTSLIRVASPDVYFDSPQKSDETRAVYLRTLEHIAATSTERVVIARGATSQTVPQLNLDPAVAILVLNSGRLPAPPYGFTESDQINNDSMMLKFSYVDVDFIIGGDAEAEAENSIRAVFSGQLDVEYYKAQHHGLPDASTAAWVAELNPRVSFIPNTDLVWNGDFLDAIASTSSKLRNIGAHIYIIDEAEALAVSRTSRQYNVTFATDGLSYEVRIELAQQSTPTKPSLEALQCMIRGHARDALRVESAPEELP